MKYLILIAITLIGCDNPTSSATYTPPKPIDQYNQYGQMIKSGYEWCGIEKELVTDGRGPATGKYYVDCETPITKDEYDKTVYRDCTEWGSCNPNGVFEGYK